MYTKRYKLRVDRDREESVQLVNELLAEGAARARATVLSLRLGRESALTGSPRRVRRERHMRASGAR